MNIGIVDYGMGNVFSVKNTLSNLGIECVLCAKPEDLNNLDKIILPGVGAFKDCMQILHQKNFVNALNENVLIKKKDILGICLGMQIMATKGYEGQETNGLGWIKGNVKKINSSKRKIPNIGWEEININPDTKLYQSLPKENEFYFIHSYHLLCDKKNIVTGYYAFEQNNITASIEHENIFGTQYHPEKSSDIGKQILLNFID